MNINELRKDIGCWNSDDSTLLDDIAYSLMCEKIENSGWFHINQLYFIFHKTHTPYSKYYTKSNIILRNKKMNKLKYQR